MTLLKLLLSLFAWPAWPALDVHGDEPPPPPNP